jgi:hypothetical protein
VSVLDWIQNTFYLDTTAAGVFVTSESIVKVFIPMVTRERVFLDRCLAMDVCSDSGIQALGSTTQNPMSGPRYEQ